MAYLLDRINQELGKTGYATGSTRSREWLRKKVNELKPTAQSLMNDRERLRSSTFIGGMYFFYYDPKLKKTLPYYDRFPLVIPIERYSDGFLGLNLHYIHPKQRITLLDKLSETLNNDKYDKTTKFRINYDYLRAATKIYEATPCIKRYLYPYIQSRFLEISADEWDIAALLPAENFMGATTSKVHHDSRKKY